MQKHASAVARSPLAKMATYLRACRAVGHLNLRGFPLLPKQLWSNPPYSRQQFNTFVHWLAILQMPEIRVAIDVGANCGDFTHAIRVVAPEASVYMVEPLPSLFDGLQRLCEKSHGLLHLYTKALSDKPGKAELYVDPIDHSIGSLMEFNQEYKSFNRSLSADTDAIVCETETLDTMSRSAQLERIDLLKIDVEGFEFHVLEGGRKPSPARKR